MTKRFKCHECDHLNEFDPNDTRYDTEVYEAFADYRDESQAIPKTYILECKKCGTKNKVIVNLYNE